MTKACVWLARGVSAALCLSSLPAASQPDKVLKDKQEDFGKPLLISDCLGQEKDSNYPFSVESIRRSLKITDASPDTVRILVVDNGFIGYRLNSGRTDGPIYVDSRNYPQGFFDVPKNRDFLPFFELGKVTPLPAPGLLGKPDPVIVKDIVDNHGGHGTHVAGIVMGGKYDQRPPKPGEGSFLKPDVRRALLTDPEGSSPYSWLRIKFVPVMFGDGQQTIDPISELMAVLQMPKADETHIVNMSLTRTLPSFRTPYRLPDMKPQVLVVLAAGNAGIPLGRHVLALSAKLDRDKRLLLVASHDADGELSQFSNYGGNVDIAAPGCKILSWLDGESDAVPLSGTSMSTAIVSFAAALLRSQWGPTSGAALRNRLLASARYNPKLDGQCRRAKAQSKRDIDPDLCVIDGAMLDIATAVLLQDDFIEYKQCEDDKPDTCKAKSAVGNVISIPNFFIKCVVPAPSDEVAGLTYNAAIKRTEPSRFLVQTETTATPGSDALLTAKCPVPDSGAGEIVKFNAKGLQPDGTEDKTVRQIEVRVADLERLVTRVM